MKNKLSQLQKFILQLAKKKGSVSNPDILIQWYGFKRSPYGKLNFKRKEIGIKRYNSATASVARSLTRLRKKELLVRGSYGYHQLRKADYYSRN